MYKKIVLSVLIIFSLVFSVPVSAQTETQNSGPVYIIQEGDTLWDIAIRFGVTVDAIMAANNMTSQNIFPGTQLIIPGLEGLSGTLITLPIPYGYDIRSISRKYQVDQSLLEKINHIISPSELYAGYEMIILQQDENKEFNARFTLGTGETILELSAKKNTNPWIISSENRITNPATSLPGDIFFNYQSEINNSISGLPLYFNNIDVDPIPMTQGDTVEIKVGIAGDAVLTGNLGEYQLYFFPNQEGAQVALQGIHAMLDPGLYPLRINAVTADSDSQTFEQLVLVKSGNFPSDPNLIVDPETIDPSITGPEDEWLQSTIASVSPDKYWQGMFVGPVASSTGDFHDCLRSFYGNHRSYNNGAYISFHTGLDFGVCSNIKPFDIYAPADGVVIFTGLKTVRGNATIIDHGHGVYSGLYHQEEIYVSVGDRVTAGELIGKMGKTGRVTGVHLHWDLFVNGIQVNPLNWLSQKYPH